MSWDGLVYRSSLTSMVIGNKSWHFRWGKPHTRILKISESSAQWNRVFDVQMAEERKQPKRKGFKGQRFSIIQLMGNPWLEQSSYQQLPTPAHSRCISEAQAVHPNSGVWRNCLCTSTYLTILSPLLITTSPTSPGLFPLHWVRQGSLQLTRNSKEHDRKATINLRT